MSAVVSDMLTSFTEKVQGLGSDLTFCLDQLRPSCN